ncbi:MAG: hypothetical protein VXW22_04595 [Pseudomonadota bacterium]|nr:hypothetical protein [Pseudomonadota bacterium]
MKIGSFCRHKFRDPVLLLGVALVAFGLAINARLSSLPTLQTIEGQVTTAAFTYSRGNHNILTLEITDHAEPIKMKVAEKDKGRIIEALSQPASIVRVGVKPTDHIFHTPRRVFWLCTLEVDGEVIQSLDQFKSKRDRESNLLALFSIAAFLISLATYLRRAKRLNRS